MTDEQKEIEELSSLIYKFIGCAYEAKKLAEYLYRDNSYRKVDEVRKETAKEILQEVYQNAGGVWFACLCEKYGVTVDDNATH